MLRVGLSGGIGSGKSTVSAALADLGAVVIDSDRLAREVVEPGTPGLEAIRERFGDAVVGADGALDRPALGALVFDDEQARRDLEGITHPLIAARTAELMAAAAPDAVVVHDVPLLVEKAMGAAYHLVVIVGVGEEERVRRLVELRGMDEEAARARIRAQASDEERRRAADVWLPNEGTVEELRTSVARLYADRLVPFERNVREGLASRRPETLEIVDPDPTWPSQAARLVARLQRALGTTALRVDHVGSTAVPGLPAKDVIDLQVGVASLEDADRPETLAALADAGFPRRRRDYLDHDPQTGLAVHPKRLHGNADPARVTHIHVREVAGPAWRRALLFRDWLTADAEAHRDYRELKVRLAAQGLTTSDYAAAKEPWFAQAFPRAEAWAEQSGWQSPAP